MIRISPQRIPTKKNRITAAFIHYSFKAVHSIGSLLSLRYRKIDCIPNSNELKKILILRLDFLGDVTVSTPAFNGIREIFSGAHITLLAANLTKELVEVMPYFDEIIYFDAPWIFKKSNNKLKKVLNIIKEIRKKKYDIAIDLRGDFRHNIFMFLSNIRYRVGFNITGCNFLLTDVIPCSTNHHSVSLCLDLLKYLGFKYRADHKLCLHITEHDRLKAKVIINKLKINRSENSCPIVIIHPGASWHGRKWKAERFAQVADLLMSEYNAKIIIAGSILDKETAEKIGSKMKYKAVIAAGETSIREFIGLLEKGDVYLGLDSGPMHMASAIGIKIVALFGPAYPDSVGPWGNGHVIVTHQKDFPCSPCSQTKCKKQGNSCMDAIQVDEVYNAVSIQIKMLGDQI